MGESVDEILQQGKKSYKKRKCKIQNAYKQRLKESGNWTELNKGVRQSIQCKKVKTNYKGRKERWYDDECKKEETKRKLARKNVVK